MAIPPHVQEARKWISDWQRHQLEQREAVVKNTEGAKTTPAAKSKPASPFAPASVSLDGTQTYTSIALSSVSYKQAFEASKH